MLDEPTNDLDLETLDVLEDMLGDYAGTVLLISHDRDFLDRLVAGVIVPEGNGRWIEYAGGYTRHAGAARRRSDARGAAETRGSERGHTARPSKADAAKRRMTFKDKHALETLPGEIAAMQARAKALQDKLDDPDFYARDRSGFEEATAALGALQRDITAAEERWLALEMEREALEG